jgi:SAM-dependent methyltransferase
MLYFFDDPAAVVAEARRILKAGGTFATCAPSRYDCPELHAVLPPEAFEETFASEDIPGVLDAFFADVEINVWDAPMFDLPDHETVRGYLHAHYYPLFTADEADAAAAQITTPLKLTKRGAWGVGRKRS